MTVSLTYDALVRLASWTNDYGSVFTVEGSAVKNGRDPAAALARAQANGHDTVGVIYTGGALVGGPGAADHYARQRARYASAVVIEDGQAVEIDGRPYTVRVVRGNGGAYPRNSDPINFDPA